MALLEKLANLFKLNIPDLLSTIFSGYTKRFGEKKYDEFMKTNIGEHLKKLPTEKKQLTEMAMYFFTGVFEQKFPENNVLQKYIKAVLSDSGSEVAKRMMNGIHAGLEKIPLTVERVTLMDLLCNLDEEALKILVEKLYAMDTAERKVLMHEMEYLNPEKLRKISEMNNSDFQKFSSIFQSKKGFWQKEIESIETALKNYVSSDKEEQR